MPYLGSRSRYQSRCGDANRSSSQFGIDRLPPPVLVRLQHGISHVLGQSAVVEARGGGAVFDPVVKFVNRYRLRPQRVADRIYQSCGMYEPLITPNRSMATVFREAGMEVRYREHRDGHNWENWRDRLREGLTWLHPGEQRFVYE